VQWVPGAVSLAKRQGREADHSPPSSAEVKNGGSMPLPPIRLHGVVLNELSQNTTFTIYIFAVFFNLEGYIHV
jgi:hypothetical protein